MIRFAKPAHRALAGAKNNTLEDLCRIAEAEIEQLHGIGANALAKLKIALEERGLFFENRCDFAKVLLAC